MSEKMTWLLVVALVLAQSGDLLAQEVPAPTTATVTAPTQDPASPPEDLGETTEDFNETVPEDFNEENPDDDIDWEGDGAEVEGAEDPYQLRLYGIADANHIIPLWDDKSLYSSFFERQENSFFLGNLSLYASKPISATIRSLMQVRFLFAPNGVENERTTYADHNDFNSSRDWGGVQIQRAWVEKDVNTKLTARVGYFLTPFGIWNVDHAAVTIIGVRRPYVIGQKLFPEYQMGAMVHGKLQVRDLNVGYNFYVGNGRSPFPAQRDLDEEKGVGGRIEVSGNGEAQWIVGVSGLVDHFSDRGEIELDENLEAKAEYTAQADELSAGLDLSVDYRGFVFRGELLYNERLYHGARPVLEGNVLESDFRRYGGYGLVGYEIPKTNIMPYYYYEYYEWGDSLEFKSLQGHSLGLRWRPSPAYVVKTEYMYAPIEDRFAVDLQALSTIITQVAWAF